MPPLVYRGWLGNGEDKTVSDGEICEPKDDGPLRVVRGPVQRNQNLLELENRAPDQPWGPGVGTRSV